MKRAARLLGGLGWGTHHILAALLFTLPPAEASEGLREVVLEVSVNAATGGEMLVVLRDEGSGLWLQAADFARLRLKPPRSTPVESGGHQYYPLNAIEGATVVIDEALQHANLQLPPNAFEPTHLHGMTRGESAASRVDPGAFLNYQLSGQRIGSDASAGVLAELGTFGNPGVLTNTVIARAAGGSDRGVRLDTTLTHDFPERLETLACGDSISSPGAWGNAIRFAGLHWGRNFGIRPDLVTTPLLAAGGAAVVPSTVDVFVNNQRVSSQSVPSGPFVIDQLPAVSGAGDVRLVVRDSLGYEQTIIRPFYSGASLLARGLSQYAIDVGSVREDYALDSFHYGAAVSSATYRRGLSDELTLEGHGEFQAHDARAFGLDLAARAGSWGIASVTLAQGGSANDSGWLTGFGFERRGQKLSFLVNTLYATDRFRQIGDSSLVGAPFRQRTLVQAGENLGRAGSVALAWVNQTYRSASPQRVVSVSYNLRVGQFGWFGLTANHTTGAQSSSTIYGNYTIALGESRSLSVDQITTRGASPEDELFATVAQNAPVGPGTGWRLGVATSGNYDASWQGRSTVVDVQLEAARNQGISGERGLLAGAMTWLDSDVRAARAVTGSFAVVDVAGVPDVPVYLDNQLVARTDASGRVVLHDLRAYEPNRISVDPEDLPLDTSIEAGRIVVRPPYRSGVVARFPIEHIRGGTFRLVTPDRKPVPAGAVVRFNGGTFSVALDGVTYVDTFDHGTQGEASWSATRCKFRLDPPPPGDPLPDMGTVVCKVHTSTDVTDHH